MEMHVVIPEVEAVTALVDSPVVVGDTLGEGDTPTGMQIHVVTKEAMGGRHQPQQNGFKRKTKEKDTVITTLKLFSLVCQYQLSV